jgi:hypothetical protein
VSTLGSSNAYQHIRAAASRVAVRKAHGVVEQVQRRGVADFYAALASSDAQSAPQPE